MQGARTMGRIPSTLAWYYASGFIFLSICVHILLHRSKAPVKRSMKLPPGPPGWPIVGNLFLLGKKPNESLFRLAQEYGPLVTLRLGTKTTVLISSSATAKEILKTNDHIAAFRAVPRALDCLSHHESSTIWAQCGPRWRMLRRICNSELFAAKSLKSLQHMRREQVSQMIGLVFEDYLRGNTVKIGQAAFATSCTLLWNMIVTDNMFHIHSSIFQEFKETMWETTRTASAPNLADFYPFLRFNGRGTARVFKVFEKLMDYRLVSSKYRDRDRDGTAEAKDFLDVLMDIRASDGEGAKFFTREDINSLLFDIFSAGSETISTTVEWAMAELLRNPDAMKRAQAELDEVIGRDRRLEESDIQHLSYLHAVVKEVFRLHPPFPLLIPQRASTSLQIEGFYTPKDTEFIVNVWGMGRDPSTWNEPLKFEPDRFLKSDSRGNDFELMPFGAGIGICKGICAGLPLANLMVRWMLASLVHSFDWGLPDGQISEQMDMTEKFGDTLAKAEPLSAIPKARLPIIL